MDNATQQARTSLERVVMAYDGLGNLVATPESATVKIKAMPTAIDMDHGTPFTPRLARLLFCEGIDQLPSRLVRIEPPGTIREKMCLRERGDGTRFYESAEVPSEWLMVELEFAKPIRGSLTGSNKRSVFVVDERDACDPYFAELSATDRARIVEAFREGAIRHGA